MIILLVKEEIKLPGKDRLLVDNEYVIMTEVAYNENVTQRELSRKLGVSVSTVNVLMNKMIKEGLIKMTQVSQKQVLYMLTPVGMMEKAKKTVRYLKGHYRVIYETKEDIKAYLDTINQDKNDIYVLQSDDEMGDILNIAVSEYNHKHSKSDIKIINSKQDIDVDRKRLTILLHMADDEEAHKEILEECSGIENIEIVNLVTIL